MKFTAHNIRLDDGRYTCPEVGYTIADHPWCKSAAGLLSAVFPGDKSRIRVADLGCLEGGYTVEFARLGFQAVGIGSSARGRRHTVPPKSCDGSLHLVNRTC